MHLDTFNVICGIVTIASFLLSVVLFIQDHTLRRSLEAGLIGLIGTLDTLAYAAKGPDESEVIESSEKRALRAKLLGYAVSSRNHAIALLKSFSDKEERFKTFDFGLDGDSAQERLQQRKEKFLCVAAGQPVHTPQGVKLIDEISAGDIVLSFDVKGGLLATDKVTAVRAAEADRYIRLNDHLEVTESHRLWCLERGWVTADHLQLGDVLVTAAGKTDTVVSLRLVPERVKVFALSVKSHSCFFVGGYLAHNK
jgi:Pretoxin HINT domain